MFPIPTSSERMKMMFGLVGVAWAGRALAISSFWAWSGAGRKSAVRAKAVRKARWIGFTGANSGRLGNSDKVVISLREMCQVSEIGQAFAQSLPHWKTHLAERDDHYLLTIPS